MKSITISETTQVGCKKITYEIPEDVYEYVIKVLEGEEPVPTVTMAEVDPAPETY